ncbi:MAG: Nif3-like dinuclear metal center hexameric protein [Microscillaceae bacterium]|nr:Nif3-like dinuclear metal center hexameric protein [Microscillaceae bacterium]
MPKIQDITRHLEALAPLNYQESYDNAGLLTGNPQNEVKGVLFTLDCLESVVEEALRKDCNLIVAHHPIIFKGLKSLTGKSYIERTVIQAIKNDIAIYAIHTNLDQVQNGVNFKIAEKLELQKVSILSPKTQTLMKLTTFVPASHTSEVLSALGQAGAGQIGEYKNCSFRVLGTGTFQPSEKANPYIGTANQLEEVEEHRIEVIFPNHLQTAVFKALHEAHPYEEIAYYLHQVENLNQEIGSGAIGELPEALEPRLFLAYLKEKMNLQVIRHTQLSNKPIQKVALCGGAGSFLLAAAKRQKADVFITADYKYHEFFDAEGQILIADIGHYESEVYTKELLYDYVRAVFGGLKLELSEVNTNPVGYFK